MFVLGCIVGAMVIQGVEVQCETSWNPLVYRSQMNALMNSPWMTDETWQTLRTHRSTIGTGIFLSGATIVAAALGGPTVGFNCLMASMSYMQSQKVATQSTCVTNATPAGYQNVMLVDGQGGMTMQASPTQALLNASRDAAEQVIQTRVRRRMRHKQRAIDNGSGADDMQILNVD